MNVLYCFLLIILPFFTNVCNGFPDQGKWTFPVKKKLCHYFEIHKALYKNSTISIKVMCDPSKDSNHNMNIKLQYVIRESPCFEEYLEPQLSTPGLLEHYYQCPSKATFDYSYDKVHFLKTPEIEVECNHLVDQKLNNIGGTFVTTSFSNYNDSSCLKIPQICDSSPVSSIITSDLQPDSMNMFDASISKRSNIPKPPIRSDIIGHTYQSDQSQVIIPSEGVYLLILFIHSSDGVSTFDAIVDIEMKSEKGYLSAVEWPLLPFYGGMSIVYLIYAIVWLIMSALQWRDLLRIQFWIGGLIFLGMVEKAVFYAEYQAINSTGRSLKGAFFFAGIISCFKRTLARMLVIIVSLGFGIVKPRLGPMLQKVVCVGGLFFIVSAIEVALRIYHPKNDPTNQTLMAGIPLAVLDSIIFWWIFSSLLQTMRTLKLRRNLVKLNSYRIFTNTLTFAVLASIVFMVWMINHHKITRCLTDWKTLWLDDAYWDISFAIVLLVIMILWRPTNNNQRYAFSPLLDASDDEEELSDTVIPGEAFDRVKMRHLSSSNNKTKDSILSKEAEEDLKWIEENIPPSLIDVALPALLDSDEELMTTRFEMNKME